MDIVPRESFANYSVIPGTWYFKCNRKPYWNISKSKTRYCVRGIDGIYPFSITTKKWQFTLTLFWW